MTEIDKMFKNAGTKPLCQIPDKFCGMKNIYEDFTAEKQIELIKWLAKLDGHFEISCTYNKEAYLFDFYFNRKTEKHKNPIFPYSTIKSSDFVEF